MQSPQPGMQESWPVGPVVSEFPTAKFVKLLAIFVGVLIFVGMVAFHIAIILPRPGTSQSTDPDQVAYIVTIRALTAVFAAAMDAAVALAVTCSWYWGLTRPDLTEGARRGLFLFGTVFLGIWLLLSTASVSLLRVLIP